MESTEGDKGDSEAFLGMTLENVVKNMYKIRLAFDPSISDEAIGKWIDSFLPLSSEKIDRELQIEEISLYENSPKDLHIGWELRNHLTGRLLVTFKNKSLMKTCLEFIRPESLWDLILVRVGEFEKLRRSLLSFVCGVYSKYDLPHTIMEHVELIEVAEINAMGSSLGYGFDTVQAMYFFQDGDRSPLDMVLSFVVRWEDGQKLVSMAGAKTQVAQFERLCIMEGFELARINFANNHLNNPQKRSLSPHKMPEISLRRFLHAKEVECIPIRSVADIIGISRRPWAMRGIAWSPGEEILFHLPLQDVSKQAPLLKFAVANFEKSHFMLVLIRTYELLLGNVRAWWIPHVQSIIFKSKTNGAHTYVDMLLIFYSHPEVVTLAHKYEYCVFYF